MPNHPFIWRDSPLSTIRELLDGATAAVDSGDAQEFMDAYRSYTEHADANIGYIVGYVEPAERRDALWAALGTRHPILG